MKTTWRYSVACTLMLVVVSSCTTTSLSKRDIVEALCSSKVIGTEAFLLENGMQIGTNNLSWIVLTLRHDSPLMSGRYDWGINTNDFTADALSAYWTKNDSLFSDEDVQINHLSSTGITSEIAGELRIATKYGLKARVLFKLKQSDTGLLVHEATVPLVGARNAEGGLTIISDGVCVIDQ